MIRPRGRPSGAENRRRLTKNVKDLHTDLKMKGHTDMKMEEVTSTARERAFENSTLRQLSQFERVQVKTMMPDEVNPETALAVHRADPAPDRGRRRGRGRGRGEGDHEDGDDEDGGKQYQNRLSIDTKTDDAKSKDALNRLRFIKLKS